MSRIWDICYALSVFFCDESQSQSPEIALRRLVRPLSDCGGPIAYSIFSIHGSNMFSIHMESAQIFLISYKFLWNLNPVVQKPHRFVILIIIIIILILDGASFFKPPVFFWLLTFGRIINDWPDFERFSGLSTFGRKFWVAQNFSNVPFFCWLSTFCQMI